MMTQCYQRPNNILIKQKVLQEPQSSQFVRRKLKDLRTAGEGNNWLHCTLLISHKVLVFTFMEHSFEHNKRNIDHHISAYYVTSMLLNFRLLLKPRVMMRTILIRRNYSNSVQFLNNI
jgi:hypothetical protein